ncbi:hypothetical protein [Usitatibacter palustris]|uniref:DUF4145 domain-containing protein n=1 Tax=Usitatibacter palustris TaxID=2732487 RepID=A0A6M4H4Y1_9PROT|nr:hypothetical protein [Usitatibacter palustris]QJR13584.1 hypothetical protein DSM104440_00368 [Usitatibacter palustris]
MNPTFVRNVVTLGALALAIVHVIFPSLAIDGITLALVAIAIVPWLAPLLKSLELPGGWKVEFQELQKIAAKADDAGLLSKADAAPHEDYAFQAIAGRDPNLALAGLRIEIEKRLILLCEKHGIGTTMQGLGRLLRELSSRGVLTEDESAVLTEMTYLLNAAVHGASVDPRATEWALDVGPQLIQAFEEKLQ